MIGSDFRANRSAYADVVIREATAARYAAAAPHTLCYAAYAAAREAAAALEARTRKRRVTAAAAAVVRGAAVAATGAARAKAAEARPSIRRDRFFPSNIRGYSGLGAVPSILTSAPQRRPFLRLTCA